MSPLGNSRTARKRISSRKYVCRPFVQSSLALAARNPFCEDATNAIICWSYISPAISRVRSVKRFGFRQATLAIFINEYIKIINIEINKQINKWMSFKTETDLDSACSYKHAIQRTHKVLWSWRGSVHCGQKSLERRRRQLRNGCIETRANTASRVDQGFRSEHRKGAEWESRLPLWQFCAVCPRWPCPITWLAHDSNAKAARVAGLLKVLARVG